MKANPFLTSLYLTQKKFFKSNTTFDLESNQSDSEIDNQMDLEWQLKIMDQFKDTGGKKVTKASKAASQTVGAKIKKLEANETKAIMSEVMKRKIVEKLQLESNKIWAK